jgi:ankyrin repeat protein
MFFLCKRRCCKRKLKKEDILTSISTGDLESLKKLISVFSFDVNLGMLEAVKSGQLFVVQYFLSKGATNKDECLGLASKNNNYDICRILLEKGADPVVGLRYSKSPNIIKMLYRFDQKNGTIT